MSLDGIANKKLIWADLVVVWGNLCSKGFEFESHDRILDGHFSNLFVGRIVTFVWKNEHKLKEAKDGTFFTNCVSNSSLLFMKNQSVEIIFRHKTSHCDRINKLPPQRLVPTDSSVIYSNIRRRKRWLQQTYNSYYHNPLIEFMWMLNGVWPWWWWSY